MPGTEVDVNRRNFRILRLFFSLVFSFALQYLRARLRGRSYDFFSDSVRNRQRAIKIREAALQMGGVLIKVGQFLSSRVDLLPTEYIEELALLQDEVPGVPFADVKRVVESELNAPLSSLFSSFDNSPLAAASLGQVHRGVLWTGEQVAVKAQRPGISCIVEADLGSIRYIVNWLHRYTSLGRRINLPQILVEFEETLRLELDYVREGHHAERIAIMFRDTPRIAVPRIYWSHSTARVLTMQYCPGIKITDFAGLEANGISRSEIAEVLMGAYLRQVLAEGFFHADPHPGNVFVRPGSVVVLLDFGMVGEISTQMRDNIRQVFLGIMRRDFDTVVRALQRLGFFTAGADTQAIKRALTWTVDNFIGLSFGEMRAINPQVVIDQLQGVLFAESFQIPANYAFLGRALGTLSGLCTALDPSFQFVTVAEPYARQLLSGDRGVRGVIGLLGRETHRLAKTAYNLPYLTHELLQDVQTGEVNFRGQFTEVVHAVDNLEHALRRILQGLLVVSFIVAGALVFTTHYFLLSLIAFIFALLLLLRILFSTHKRR